MNASTDKHPDLLQEVTSTWLDFVMLPWLDYHSHIGIIALYPGALCLEYTRRRKRYDVVPWICRLDEHLELTLGDTAGYL